MSRSKGVTLIELMVVIVIIAIVATIALPSFSRMIENNRLTTTTNELVGLLSFARSEAIRRGSSVTVVPAGTGFGDGVQAQWNDGSTDIQLRKINAPSGYAAITLSSGANPTFLANGRLSGTTAITFNVCGNSGSSGSDIQVSLGGQVSTEEVGC